MTRLGRLLLFCSYFLFVSVTMWSSPGRGFRLRPSRSPLSPPQWWSLRSGPALVEAWCVGGGMEISDGWRGGQRGCPAVMVIKANKEENWLHSSDPALLHPPTTPRSRLQSWCAAESGRVKGNVSAGFYSCRSSSSRSQSAAPRAQNTRSVWACFCWRVQSDWSIRAAASSN